MNRYRELRMQYLQANNPELLADLQNSGKLETHLRRLQRYAGWELEQLLFAGMEEPAAEQYVLQEYVYV